MTRAGPVSRGGDELVEARNQCRIGQLLLRRDGPPSETQTVRPPRSSWTPHSWAYPRTIRSPRPVAAIKERGAGRGVVGPPPSVTSTSTTPALTVQFTRIVPSGS